MSTRKGCFVLFACLLLILQKIHAQTISTNRNAVKQSVYTVATNSLSDASNTDKAIVTIQYLDGLGNPIQQIGYQSSPLKKDVVVNHTNYDILGRPQRNYLPTPTSYDSGKLIGNVNELAVNFYDGDKSPFSKVEYEPSPLNRTFKSYGPGNAWHENSKAVTSSYEVVSESIRKYEVNSNNDIVLSGSFPTNSLLKLRTIDEQGSQVITISDPSGHAIMKQVQETVDSWITTYYVYDNKWRQVAVLQPKAYELNQTINVNTTEWNEYVFLYKYDYRDNVISKKVPSADWEYFVYDKWNRLVCSQDALQRESSQWRFYKYDNFNRLILAGLYFESKTFQSIQNEVDTWSGGRFESRNAISPTYYTFTNCYPTTITVNNIQLVNYYDSYSDWLPSSIGYEVNGGNMLIPVGSGQGLVVGKATRYIASWLYEAMYYDVKGRMIQNHRYNLFSKPDKNELTYTFNGSLKTQFKKYSKYDGTILVTEDLRTEFDHANRVKNTSNIINSNISYSIRNTYDEIGRLNSKRYQGSIYDPGSLYLKCRVWLSGAIQGSRMRRNPYIPLEEPYTSIGGKFTHVGGGGHEMTTQAIINANSNTANEIIDWVLLELRNAYASPAIYKTRAALLQADGDIVDVDGKSDVNFGAIPSGDYIVAVKHRNHLGVMTSSTVPLTLDSPNVIDFTTLTPSQIYEKPNSGYNSYERKLTSLGYALWAGDINGDGLAMYSGASNDASYIFSKVVNAQGNPSQNTSYAVLGYNTEDLNLDGQTLYQGTGNDNSILLDEIMSHPLNTDHSNTFIIEEQLSENIYTLPHAFLPYNIQKIDYKYHIRGGLLGINLNQANQPVPDYTERDFLSYKLEYEEAGRWDGNVGKQIWNTADYKLRKYQFSYDYSKRLSSATYNGVNGENYSVPVITYDKNGNVLTLQRYGKSGSSFGIIDNLTYFYSGNKLLQVEDSNSGDNLVDFVNKNSGSQDYEYYTEGSLKKDLNKEITEVLYDAFLKLPTQISLTNGRWIRNYYSSEGTLRRKMFSSGDVWDYLGNLIIKNGVMYQLSTSDGRAIYNPTSQDWKFEYDIKDHLGNTRVTIRDSSTTNNFGSHYKSFAVVDRTDFDPWGVELNGTGLNNPVENRFKYQNKESQALFGLGGINDFGARYYDKTIGRWWGVDSHAENYFSMSPSIYVNNNPINFIDPDGKDLVKVRVPDGNGGVKYAIVDSKIAKQAYEFAWFMYKNFRLTIGEDYRTDEEQRSVVASGGMKAKVGKSRHQQGFALDFNMRTAVTKKYGKISEADVLRKFKEMGYGADLLTMWDWAYELKDYPHFQLDALDFGYKSREEAYEINKKYFEKVGGRAGVPIMEFESEYQTIILNGKEVQARPATQDEIDSFLKFIKEKINK